MQQGDHPEETVMTTSKRVARDASKALRGANTSKRGKEIAGAALEARRKPGGKKRKP